MVVVVVVEIRVLKCGSMPFEKCERVKLGFSCSDGRDGTLKTGGRESRLNENKENAPKYRGQNNGINCNIFEILTAHRTFAMVVVIVFFFFFSDM